MRNIEMLNGKIIAITGGTGSFGNAMVKHLLESGIAEIRVFSRDEKKQDEMRQHFQSKKLRFYIGDVRDPASLKTVMEGVDYVFHAAALKQVPSCEFYPMEAVKTNIIGTENVLSTAIDNRVKKVICLSTDKAVHPVNAMGISKALMEKVVLAKARMLGEKAVTTLCITRYGNVLASRGSVIPLFIDQIKSKKPITITDPDMTRFMMTLDEAVDLVFFSFAHGRQGDLFVQKAPSSNIGVIAKTLKEIFNASNEINIIGTRHGEKKHEVLLSREEKLNSIEEGNYYRIPLDTRDLNYSLYFSEGTPSVSLSEHYSSDNTRQLSNEEVFSVLKNLDYVQDRLEGRAVS